MAMLGRTGRRIVGVLVALVVAASACTGSSGGDGVGGGSDDGATPVTPMEIAGTIDLSVEHPDRCDPIATDCLLPFPNDFFTVADESTPTGRRVHLDAASMPVNAAGTGIDPTHWNELDGFSPAAAAIIRIPNIDLDASGTTPVTDPQGSLDPDAPVVLLDATTGRRLAHWEELDAAADENGEVPTLYVRPTQLLPEGHRIVVAMRDLVDADGQPIEPTDAFRAYRDGLESEVPEVEARRPAMEQVFADLSKAEVARDDLVVAWDFTVASTESLSSRLLAMRDDAFEDLGDGAPAFTVTSSVPSDREGIRSLVTGTYEVPLYLTEGGVPGSELKLDDDGTPVRTGTYTATFRCIIPASASAANPAGVGLYGHGLLGTSEQINAAAEVAAEGNRVFCATDLIGMAEEDTANAASIVGDLSSFNTLADRLQQGHLNTLVLGRLMKAADGLGTDPAFQDGGRSLLTDDLVYYGISQGGIMGAATTAVAQDWTLAVLDVPAANYGLLLDRSVDFDDFRAVMEPSYPAASDRALGLQLIQMLWDRGEASGYLQHLTAHPYDDTPAHTVLIHAAFGDHQVANVATWAEARTIGASVVTPVLADGRSPEKEPGWGLDPIGSFPFDGSAVVMWDSGAETPPVGNVPPRDGEDPHGDPRAEPAAIAQIVAFFAGDGVTDACDGDPCTAAPTD